jgi:hypothetical protein
MPLLFVLPAVAAALGYAYGGRNEANEILQTAQESKSLNLTTVAGYAIAAGVVYYFGKKIIK